MSARYRIGLLRRSTILRPQAIVVTFIVLVLLSRGEGRFLPDAAVQDQLATDQTAGATEVPLIQPSSATVVSTPMPATTPAPLRATPEPSPTSTPRPTATPVPTAKPSPTSEPTETPIPEPTERPAAPPTGLADQSLIVTQPDTGRQEIAITFDAGNGRGYTTQILDMLEEYGVVATFGVTGEWASANPDLLLDILDRGHQVINHSYSHQSFTGESTGGQPLTRAQVQAEVLDTEQAIWENSRYEVGPYFRFPYGDYSAENLAMLKDLGYDYSIWWGCDSKAWLGNGAADIVQECGVDRLAPGLIVLLHVDPDADFQALPQLIERYQANGYDLVTVEQLIQP